jgi:hypothetical protein
MANRIFDVKITAGTDLGPYDIYYNSGSGNVLAIYESTSGSTTNVSYSDLTTGTGVRVIIPDTSLTITLLNTNTNFLNSCEVDSVVHTIPTPTPTVTPTLTLTPTNTPSQTPTNTLTPGPLSEYTFYQAEQSPCVDDACSGVPTSIWFYNLSASLIVDKYYYNSENDKSYHIIDGPFTYAEYTIAGSPPAIQTNSAFASIMYNTCTCLPLVPP